VNGGRTNRIAVLLVIVMLATMVAACSSQTAEPTAVPVTEATTAPAADSGRCGDTSKLSDQLNFFNWADYIDEAILEQFQEECGVKVVMDLYTSNEELIAKIQTGNSGYDVVIPTDYALGIMADGGLLMPLNMDDIPNAKNLNPKTMGMYYDPENKYSLQRQLFPGGRAGFVGGHVRP
jgi:spermidine/putrescine transport system substrate-binding protein